MEIESLGDEISRQNKKKIKPDPTEFENIILVKYVACSNKKNRQSPNTVKILYPVLSKSVVNHYNKIVSFSGWNLLNFLIRISIIHFSKVYLSNI